MKELIGATDLSKLSPEIQMNLNMLLERVNRVRTLWGKPMTVTSGLRTKEDHIRIYKEIAAKKGVKFNISKVPMGSQHLKGFAVDIYDPGLVITAWLKANPDILKDNELWCEAGNSNWVHFQGVAPASGKRWFLP